MRCSPSGIVFLVALALLATPAPAQVAKPDDASLLAADAEQKRIIVEEDLEAQRRFMHENYIINAPANRVLRKADALAIMARGGVAAERFERVIEGHQITGNIGIVMGREVVQPTAGGDVHLTAAPSSGWAWMSRRRGVLRPSGPESVFAACRAATGSSTGGSHETYGSRLLARPDRVRGVVRSRDCA